MTTLRTVARFILLGGLLLALGLLWAPGRVAAAPVAAGSLPLPDLLIYGTVTDSNGDLLESGAIKAIVREQIIATASINTINGTDYTFLLVVPMAMLPPGSSESPTDAVLPGDLLSLFVDNAPAYYQDPVTSLTVTELKIPEDGPGRGYVLDLNLLGAMQYTIGDVNASGVRNSADAMLTLKYDIGLIAGVTAFPPGPNTVYLPLCDVVENGRCDSIDALRILQCEVGIPGITCPTDQYSARSRTEQPSTVAAPVTLRTVAAAGSEPDAVAVQVTLEDPTAQFGAATLELIYDPSLFAVVGCAENPTGKLDLVSCNATYRPGVVRFNGILSAESGDGAPLVIVQFKRQGPLAADLGTLFGLRADGVFDQAGNALPWSTGAATATPDAASFKLFVPTIASQAGHLGLPGADAEAEPVTPETLNYWLHLPVIGAQAGKAVEFNTAPNPEGAPTAVISETTVITETEEVTETVDTDPGTEPAPDPTAPVEPTPDATTGQPGGSMPPPVSTPVADLPKNEQPDDESSGGQRFYLPLVTEE